MEWLLALNSESVPGILKSTGSLISDLQNRTTGSGVDKESSEDSQCLGLLGSDPASPKNEQRGKLSAWDHNIKYMQHTKKDLKAVVRLKDDSSAAINFRKHSLNV